MERSFRQLACLFIILAWMAVSLGPAGATTWAAPPWIDKIALTVMEQKNLSTSGNFTPYFQQLEVVSEAAAKGEYNGKRNGMNRFLEMLETREGGISVDAAHKIFSAVAKSVPYAVLLPLKSEDKLDQEEKALVERMKRFAASIRDQDERASMAH